MPGQSVLVVDDNVTNLKLLEYLLQASGFQVHTAGDAEAALEAVKAYEPGLVLMDLQLPGTDGLTLTRQLKDDPSTAHIVVLAVTAYAMKGDEERALAAGCDGYLSKPIDTRSLPKLVAQYLAKSAPNSGT
jgi:CheY-like chemotaxis protein